MQDIILGLSGDGLLHAFRILDDGAPTKTALCGAASVPLEPSEHDDVVCDDCARDLCRAFGLPEERFLAYARRLARA